MCKTTKTIIAFRGIELIFIINRGIIGRKIENKDKNKRIKEPVSGYTFRRKGGMKDDRIFYCPAVGSADECAGGI